MGTIFRKLFWEVENKIKPLIDSILRTPYSQVSGNLCVNRIDSKYNAIFGYLLQTIMLQMAHRDKTNVKFTDELMVVESLKMGVDYHEGLYLVRFNHLVFADMPLILMDNAATVYITPPINSNTDYSVCYIMPISPYYLLVWGSRMQVDFFLYSKRHPHIININRILTEDKKCLVASQNEKYLRWLAKEYPYYQFDSLSGAIPKTQREFI